MKKKLVPAGYTAAILCFIINLCLRIGSPMANAFLMTGFLLLAVTGLFNILAVRRKQ